jgi:hypothetical protein
MKSKGKALHLAAGLVWLVDFSSRFYFSFFYLSHVPPLWALKQKMESKGKGFRLLGCALVRGPEER